MTGISRSLIIAISLCIVASSPTWAVKVGESVPAFSFQGLDGRTYTEAQFAGKVLVLYFLGYS